MPKRGVFDRLGITPMAGKPSAGRGGGGREGAAEVTLKFSCRLIKPQQCPKNVNLRCTKLLALGKISPKKGFLMCLTLRVKFTGHCSKTESNVQPPSFFVQ